MKFEWRIGSLILQHTPHSLPCLEIPTSSTAVAWVIWITAEVMSRLRAKMASTWLWLLKQWYAYPLCVLLRYCLRLANFKFDILIWLWLSKQQCVYFEGACGISESRPFCMHPSFIASLQHYQPNGYIRYQRIIWGMYPDMIFLVMFASLHLVMFVAHEAVLF